MEDGIHSLYLLHVVNILVAYLAEGLTRGSRGLLDNILTSSKEGKRNN